MAEILQNNSVEMTTTVSEAEAQSSIDFMKNRMHLFDTRMYRRLDVIMKGGKPNINLVYPHFDYGSYVMDFHETPTALQNKAEEAKNSKEKEQILKKKEAVEKFIKDSSIEYLGPRSFIHPYALIKLAGASGSKAAVERAFTYDRFDQRRFYEIDGAMQFSGNYSKTPTTTNLIRWGNESPRNKTPYSFQDFVFCKHWNKIENNRLITLRRYAAPVTDNIEFSDYVLEAVAGASNDDFAVVSGSNKATNDSNATVSKMRGKYSDSPWTPLATAVTYFGEDTGNNLAEILSFSAKYNWEKMGEKNKDPMIISSSQNDQGTNLVNDAFGLTDGLGSIAKFMGFMGEVQNGMSLNLDNAPNNIPPDPYENGPYENRILGPINVIMNTYRRERGLTFTHEGLRIKFSYVARPIAGINNKAILLDLMSNILVLTYSSGSWFGGMWKYKCDKPALYPWKYGDAMNKLYRGEIFGKDGAAVTLMKKAFQDGQSYVANFLPDVSNMLSNIFGGAIDFAKGLITKNDEKKEEGADKLAAAANSGIGKAIQKVIAAKALRGTSIPYIRGNRALLTGDPVGDWHLTIGNPFNPIAMIGNLIVKNVEFKWNEELGPDDFPTGFEATVTLDHGLGRDRDAIESMFNRGFGRIYTLPSEFRSTADGETKVDENTGTKGKPREGYDEVRNTYFGGGTRFIAKTQTGPLANSGVQYQGNTLNLTSLKPTNSAKTQHAISTYYITPWQMGYNM